MIELDRITEDRLHTLNNLIEFVAYDLSELNRAKISEKGSYIWNLNPRQWYDNPKFRRKNVGKEAAIQAFNLYKGRWRVSEFDWNVPAQLFWRKVLKDYTGNQYVELRRRDNKGPMQEFTNS